MAHFTEPVGFPMIPLSGGMELRLEALDPTTDAEVAGVTASRWSIYGDDNVAPDQGPEVDPLLSLVSTDWL